MKEANATHDNNFDLIRLVASIQVLLLHHIAFFTSQTGINYDLINKLIWNFPGVNVFFIISGYLIFQSLERNKFSLFAKKRLKRIFPALIICFFLTIILLFSFNSLNYHEIFSLDFLKWMLAQLTLFQFYNPDIVRDFGFGPPNGALWTISVEIQFYLFVSALWYLFLTKCSKKSTNIILIILFLMSAIFNHIFNRFLSPDGLAYKLSFVFFFSYLYIFIAGAIIYINRDLLMPIFKGKALIWLSIFFSICFTLGYFEITYYRYVFNGLSFAMLIVLSGLVFSMAYTKSELSQRLLKGNDISYGVYIYQMPILNLFFHLSLNTSTYQFVCSIIFCLIMGFLSWFLIEKKVLNR